VLFSTFHRARDAVDGGETTSACLRETGCVQSISFAIMWSSDSCRTNVFRRRRREGVSSKDATGRKNVFSNRHLVFRTKVGVGDSNPPASSASSPDVGEDEDEPELGADMLLSLSSARGGICVADLFAGVAVFPPGPGPVPRSRLPRMLEHSIGLFQSDLSRESEEGVGIFASKE
jgi:hypothetical protein